MAAFDDVSSLLYGAGSALPQHQGGLGGYFSNLGSSLMQLPQSYAQGYGGMLQNPMAALGQYGQALQNFGQPGQGWTAPRPQAPQTPAPMAPMAEPQQPLTPAPMQAAPGFRFGAIR
jgi:hypothetical protein